MQNLILGSSPRLIVLSEKQSLNPSSLSRAASPSVLSGSSSALPRHANERTHPALVIPRNLPESGDCSVEPVVPLPPPSLKKISTTQPGVLRSSKKLVTRPKQMLGIPSASADSFVKMPNVCPRPADTISPSQSTRKSNSSIGQLLTEQRLVRGAPIPMPTEACQNHPENPPSSPRPTPKRLNSMPTGFKHKDPLSRPNVVAGVSVHNPTTPSMDLAPHIDSSVIEVRPSMQVDISTQSAPVIVPFVPA